MANMSLDEAKMGYEKLIDSLRELENNLKQLKVETKETLSLLPVAVLPCSTEEETQKAAYYFYWHCPEITTTTIRDALKLETGERLLDYIGPFIQEMPCGECGNILKAKKHSRSSCRTEIEVCQICLVKKKEQEEQGKRWEERRAKIGFKGFTPKTLHETYGAAVYRQKEPAIKAAMAWADGSLEKLGLMLMGNVGTGKTTLALWAMCRYAMRTNKTMLLIKYPDFNIEKCYHENNFDYTMKRDSIYMAQCAEILMIDNLGNISLPVYAEALSDKQEVILRILDHRIQHDLPTIIITSLGEMHLGAQFNDAIMGRLKEFCGWIEMGGKDLRNQPMIDVVIETPNWNFPQTEMQRQALTATNRNKFRTRSEYKKMLEIEKSFGEGILPMGFWENRLWSAKRYNWSLPKLLKYTLDKNNLKRWQAKQKESEKVLNTIAVNQLIGNNQQHQITSYDEYLQTEHWQNKRKQALQMANYKCQLCNNDDNILHVHHKTYVNLWDEQEDDLIVLCEQCHKRHHDKIKT